MAGDWLKMEAATPDKPEVLAITAAMGWEDPDLAVGKLFRIWRWFDQQTTDGNAVGVTLALLDRICGVTGFAQAMANVGWLIVNDDGLTLKNFDRHNGESAKQRALAAKRVAKFKSNEKGNADGNGEGNAASVTNALPKEEKNKEESIKSLSCKQDAMKVLDYLNEKTGKKFQSVPANIDLIAARLKQGATVAECMAVIDAKVVAWAGDEKMAEFLRPATLFSAKNFAQYVGQLDGALSTPKAKTVGGVAYA